METSTKTYISCIYLLGLGVLHSGKTFNLIFKPTFVAGTKDKKKMEKIQNVTAIE